MNLFKQFLLAEENQPGVLMERFTSPHVLSRGDITVILNVIKKEFGLSYGTNNDIGLCMLSQVIFSIAAAADVNEKQLGDYVAEISHRVDGETFNNLGQTIEWFNKNPMKFGDKWVQFSLNAHPITSAHELKDMLKSGQPVICAVPSAGTIDCLISDMNKVVEGGDEKYIPSFLSTNPDRYYDRELDEKHSHLYQNVKDGFISKEVFALANKYYSDGNDNDYYHSSLCFGYESGDKAFLFREPRPRYAHHGYYKIAEELFTSANIGIKKDLIHGMFYVEVMDMNEVSEPKKEYDPDAGINLDDDDDDMQRRG